MIVLIIVAISYQIKIVKMIYDKEDMLNSEPLSYGARRYDIEYCECPISETRTIIFNKTGSITKIVRKPSMPFDLQQINISTITIKE